MTSRILRNVPEHVIAEIRDRVDLVELIGAFWNENGFGVPGKEGHVLHRELNTVRIPIDDTRYMVGMPFGDTHHVVHTRRPIWCNHPRGVEGFMKLNARVYRVRSFLFSA